jgi:hypothetical protein
MDTFSFTNLVPCLELALTLAFFAPKCGPRHAQVYKGSSLALEDSKLQNVSLLEKRAKCLESQFETAVCRHRIGSAKSETTQTV